MSKLAVAIQDRAKLRADLESKVIAATASLDESDAKGLGKDTAHVEFLWTQLEKVDPAAPGYRDDMQVLALKARAKDTQRRQEALAALTISEGDTAHGARDARLREYEAELTRIAGVLAAIAEE